MPTKSNNIGGQGGARPGAGRKKSAVKNKAENGNPGGRKLEVLDIPEVEGVEMPKPHDFLSAEQRDGSELQAKEIYEETWKWLKQIGCAAKVSPQLLERYAMCSARWIQCEEMTNRMGFLSKHPTTQKPIPSPFINIGINYMNQAVRLWNEIFQIVKETLCRSAPIPRAVILCRTNSSIPLLRHCRRRTSSVNWRISFRRLPGTERSPLLRPRAPLPGWTKKAPSPKAMIPSVRFPSGPTNSEPLSRYPTNF